MKIVIIDYGAGNIQSIKFAIQRLGFEAVLTSNVEEIKNADRVIFPGVGEASTAMKMLVESGLDLLIPNLTQPVLGICLGMQLSIFDTDVVRFNHGVKVPQIGWNQISTLKSALFEGISENEYMYLVHSYYAPICNETIAVSDYGLQYSNALQKDNFYGVQFHPEKSSTAGEKLLQNFLDL